LEAADNADKICDSQNLDELGGFFKGDKRFTEFESQSEKMEIFYEIKENLMKERKELVTQHLPPLEQKLSQRFERNEINHETKWSSDAVQIFLETDEDFSVLKRIKKIGEVKKVFERLIEREKEKQKKIKRNL